MSGAQDTLNIVLIGMPGSGKTTVGAELARLTGRPVIDLDESIVKLAGKPITEIFAQDGEAEFRKMEREQAALAGRRNGIIIVTGGGVVKDPGNYPPLHRNGRIYHLERDLSLLPREGRPLSLSGDLEAMYRERLPMYERFRDVVIYNNGAPAETAEALWKDFLENP